MSTGSIKTVYKSSTSGGRDFSQKYSVQPDGSWFVIMDGVQPLPGISHADRIALEALMGDAVQNYGR